MKYSSSVGIDRRYNTTLHSSQLRTVTRNMINFRYVVSNLENQVIANHITGSTGRIGQACPPPVGKVVVHILNRSRHPLDSIVFNNLGPNKVNRGTGPDSSTTSINAKSSRRESSEFSLIIDRQVSTLSVCDSPLE